MRKGYKENVALRGMGGMNKRGQLIIIVIIAIVFVSVVIVAFFVVPRTNLFTSEVNPSSFLGECIDPAVDEIISVTTKQGGYARPDNYILYESMQVQYLCYTAENYVTCKVQQPLLVSHVEEEIKQYVQPRARECMNELVREYDKAGYSVESEPGEIEVEIIPGSIVISFLSPLTVSRESTQTFQKFSVGVNSELYDLLLTAVSIIDFESTYGDSETTQYISYYPDLRIDKIRREDGTTIYKLSNVVTQDEFTFASRSLVWPQGYGTD